ncbi:hypothetical protein [Borreliella kurtenbachii]|uniref:hypothetical protein n=1 Tax=Borreliella kurtenbachii TaxID=1196056 RepID=UPI002658731B|nr:hypothetical protein [Borreliella kurtenbachii]WKC86708.1 hypothetical protein QIA22_00175 [Borreliella kurtenbachii]
MNDIITLTSYQKIVFIVGIMCGIGIILLMILVLIKTIIAPKFIKKLRIHEEEIKNIKKLSEEFKKIEKFIVYINME